jgi:penicillin-binding protein 1A
MTLVSAFAESRNIPALKLAYRLGIRKVIETAHRFGITSDIPAFLPVALGSADITLYEQVGAYSVFPNDGIRIEPHYIRKVTQADGLPFDQKTTEVTEVISVETARTMMQLLQAVVARGTGGSASQLKHPLGGKTGTTNDYTDAWFIGFSPSITCGTWIGFDDRQSLGEKETGARAALPMWMDFMRAAIASKPDEAFASANAPKKVLDVPLSKPGSTEKEVKPKAPEDAAPDRSRAVPIAPKLPATNAAPADTAAPLAGKPKSPAVMRPAAPPAVRPVAPMVTPAKPTASPLKGATVPAKPEQIQRMGVSNPPPDTF